VTNYLGIMRLNRRLFLLWAGTFISSLGDWFRHISIVALVICISGVGIEMGLLLILELIPLVLIGPIAGMLIDKLDIRKVMAGCDITRALLTLGFTFLNSHDGLYLAYILIALISTVDQIHFASRNVLISRIIPDFQLITVNALFTLTSGFCLAGGSFLAATIMSGLETNTAFIFDALTFVFSALTVCGIRSCSYSLTTDEKTVSFAAMKKTISYICSAHSVYILMLFNFIRLFNYGVIYTLLGVFGAYVYRHGVSGIGAFYGSFGIGTLFGGICAGKLAERIRPQDYFLTLGAMVVAEGVFYLGSGQFSFIALSLVTITAAFTARGVAATIYSSLMMRLVPNEIRGKVFMVDRVCSCAFMSIGIGICSMGLVAVSPKEFTLLSGGLLFLSGSVWLLIVKKNRLSNFTPLAYQNKST